MESQEGIAPVVPEEVKEQRPESMASTVAGSDFHDAVADSHHGGEATARDHPAPSEPTHSHHARTGSTNEPAPVPRRSRAPTLQSSASEPHLIHHDRAESHDNPSEALLKSLRAQISELGSQVSDLNSKLVRSYERVGDLEDELHHRGEEGTRFKERVNVLERERSKHEEMIEGGLLVERVHVQNEMQGMMERILEETQQRGKAEADKATIERELDDLSASLFGEANRMVALERYEKVKAIEKSESLEAALKDTELMMTGQVEQMQGLKKKLEDTERERDSLRFAAAGSGGLGLSAISAPSTSFAEGDGAVLQKIDNNSGGGGIPPPLYSAVSRAESIASSTPFSVSSISFHSNHGLPNLLTDILPFFEFIAFIAHLKRLRQQTITRPIVLPDEQQPSLYSSPHIAIRAPSPASAISPNGTSQFQSLQKEYQQQLLAPLLPLSTHLGQAFLKRCVEEDSDPALRLDIAPGLNWITRRNINTAIIEGNLVIEPVHGPAALTTDKCALCGSGLDKWYDVDVIRKSEPARQVDSALRKMLGSGSWGIGNLGRKSSGGTSSTLSSTTNGHTSGETPASTNPPSPTASHFGRNQLHPNRRVDDQRVYVFRAAESSTTNYPLCPTYCLQRLRTVCDFWTYIRVMERGLLMEDGFRFGNRIEEDHGAGNVNGNGKDRANGHADVDGVSIPRSESPDHVARPVPKRPVPVPGAPTTGGLVPTASTESLPPNRPTSPLHTEVHPASPENSGDEPAKSENPAPDAVQATENKHTEGEEETGRENEDEPKEPANEGAKPDGTEEATSEDKTDEKSETPSEVAEAPKPEVENGTESQADTVSTEAAASQASETSAASSTDDVTTPKLAPLEDSDANSTPASGPPPPPPSRPKRSVARASTAAPLSSPTTDPSQTPKAREPPLPTIVNTSKSVSELVPGSTLPPRPPRHPRSSFPPSGSGVRGNSSTDIPTISRQYNLVDLDENQIHEREWQQRCWLEVVKLKERMFRVRVGAPVFLEDGAGAL